MILRLPCNCYHLFVHIYQILVYMVLSIKLLPSLENDNLRVINMSFHTVKIPLCKSYMGVCDGK
jgi:hypothetical protein